MTIGITTIQGVRIQAQLADYDHDFELFVRDDTRDISICIGIHDDDSLETIAIKFMRLSNYLKTHAGKTPCQ